MSEAGNVEASPDRRETTVDLAMVTRADLRRDARPADRRALNGEKPDQPKVPDQHKPTDRLVVPTDTGGLVGIIITEMMIGEKGTIPEGEWFELYNSGPAVNLAGWTLTDDFCSHTITASLVIGQNQYMVFKSSSAQVTGHVYTDTAACASAANICFSDAGDRLQLKDPNGNLVDKVLYDATWPYAQGSSMSLKSTALDNSVAASWCKETTIYGQGNSGTPGGPAGCP